MAKSKPTKKKSAKNELWDPPKTETEKKAESKGKKKAGKKAPAKKSTDKKKKKIGKTVKVASDATLQELDVTPKSVGIKFDGFTFSPLQITELSRVVQGAEDVSVTIKKKKGGYKISSNAKIADLRIRKKGVDLDFRGLDFKVTEISSLVQYIKNPDGKGQEVVRVTVETIQPTLF